jgi:hypothetical protein
VRRAARHARRSPDVLLGWVDASGCPAVVPVRVAGADDEGLVLDVAPGVVPAGGRRAGLTSHTFRPGNVGMSQRVHTGWLVAEPGATRVRYAPHTSSGWTIPPSRRAFQLAAGAATRRGLPEARRRGLA